MSPELEFEFVGNWVAQKLWRMIRCGGETDRRLLTYVPVLYISTIQNERKPCSHQIERFPLRQSYHYSYFPTILPRLPAILVQTMTPKFQTEIAIRKLKYVWRVEIFRSMGRGSMCTLRRVGGDA